MSPLRLLTPLAATVVTGIAFYFTSSVLDQVEVDGSMVRLAFVPGWQTMLGFTLVVMLLIAGLGRLNAASGAPSGRRPRLSEIVLPLFALIVLAAPYLPVLPDRWPVLQALAGPMAGVVWLVVAGLQAWVLWQTGLITLPAMDRWPRWTVPAVVFAATLTISGLAAWRLTPSPAYPGGDEPHYLVIAQSIWRDGDLDIQNNHARGDYYEYSSRELAPHYLAAGLGGVFYSVHPILMPFLMAPVYAAGGYAAVVAIFVLIAAAAAALAWRWVRDTLNAPGAATFAWAAIVGSTPYLLNSFTVYPEICAALVLMIGWGLMVTTPRDRSGVLRHVAIGLACGSLPWFSTKYAPMSAALMLVVFGRLWHWSAKDLLGEPKAWAAAIPYAAALLAWFMFFYVYWGSPLPTAPYGDHGQTSPTNLLAGGPGLLFDQEYGLLAYAPVYVLAATGLVSMWRTAAHLRRQAIEIVLVFGALVATVGAFGLWWGGSAAPGRPVVSGLLLLTLPIAVAFRDAPAGSARRAAQHLLLWVGVGIALTLVAAQNGLLIDNGRDGTAALLEYWSPRWALWSLAPTFTLQNTPVAYGHAALWLAVASAAAVVLSRWRRVGPGSAALVAVSVAAMALLLIAVAMPLLPASEPRPPINLAARSRLTALDGFDARVRPVAVIYDPLRTLNAAEVLPHLALQVTPTIRTDRTPVRLIHNGRFSLPAGTYDIAVTFSGEALPAPNAFAVQIGRLGDPFESSQLQPTPGEVWRTTLALPVDANFVGFRGPAEMERAIASIVITPTALVDAQARPRVSPVLSAARYAGASVFFHDEQSYPEGQGVWTRGRRTAAMTVAPFPGRSMPIVLRVNSGSQANTAMLRSSGWTWQGDLVPGQFQDVQLPAATRGVIPLTAAAARSYRPRDVDPASRDPRELGIRIEIQPQ